MVPARPQRPGEPGVRRHRLGPAELVEVRDGGAEPVAEVRAAVAAAQAAGARWIALDLTAEVRAAGWLVPLAREARAGGADVLVVGPGRELAAALADTTIPVLPSTEALLVALKLQRPGAPAPRARRSLRMQRLPRLAPPA